MAKGRSWQREELLAVFRLYCQTPFGKLDHRNPEIVALARLIHRTASAVAMKACNFASLDPIQKARNISGLRNASRSDQQLWEDFQSDSQEIADEAERAYEELTDQHVESPEAELIFPNGPTQSEGVRKVRRVQRFFRSAVLASYNHRCAISGISVVELLNASHIIPWSTSEARRADPRNGIALNALYDRAFDRGFITFDESLRVVISPRLRVSDPPPLHRAALLEVEGSELCAPDRFAPDSAALDFHRQHVFIQ